MYSFEATTVHQSTKWSIVFWKPQILHRVQISFFENVILIVSSCNTLIWRWKYKFLCQRFQAICGKSVTGCSYIKIIAIYSLRIVSVFLSASFSIQSFSPCKYSSLQGASFKNISNWHSHLLLLSDRAGRQQNGADVQIYETEYAHQDTQFD